LGAASNGHWQLTGVIAGTLRNPNNETPSFAPVDGASYGPGVMMTGSNYPLLTITNPSTLVPWPQRYALNGTATFSQTGAPVAGLPLDILLDYEGDWPLPADLVHVTTDSYGRWSLNTTIAGSASLVAFGDERIS